MVSNESRPAAVIIVIITAIPAMETTGIALSNQTNLPWANLLNSNPAMMGRMTIFTILHNMARKSMGTSSLASICIIKGVKIGANKVATAVRVNDKARLALEINAITLEARPLGELPTRMIPAAIAGGKSKNDARP